MQRQWIVTLQDLAITGRQWDADLPMRLLADRSRGSVEAVEAVAGDLHWQGAIERCGALFRLQGAWSGLIKRHCSRCNAPFEWLAAGESDWTFCIGDEPDGGAEAEQGEAGVCEYLAPPGEIDLIDILREDIWLAWKADVICSETCKGLCQGCGVDLNRDVCCCEQDDSDHPFALLRRLQLKD